MEQGAGREVWSRKQAMELGNSACACVPRIFRVKLADCERVVNFFPLSSEHGGKWLMGSFVRATWLMMGTNDLA